MNVIIFGATGSVGRLTVERTLADRHHVTAFARRPERLNIDHPNLHLFPGDAMIAEDVDRAVAGQDAVVVVLGAGADRSSRIRSVGTLNVIRAMHRHGVTRLICQSTLGARDSWNNLNVFWKRIMFGLLLRQVLRDHEVQEQIVEASGLDWTIVRPGAFIDAPAGTGYREDVPATARDLSLKIGRADLAAFLARQLFDGTYRHRAVAVTR